MIAASETVSHLGTMVPILPASERQARPLTRLEPDQQREAWREAVDVTHQTVSNVVDSSKNSMLGKFTKTFTPLLYNVWKLANVRRGGDRRSQQTNGPIGPLIAQPEAAEMIAQDKPPNRLLCLLQACKQAT